MGYNQEAMIPIILIPRNFKNHLELYIAVLGYFQKSLGTYFMQGTQYAIMAQFSQ